MVEQSGRSTQRQTVRWWTLGVLGTAFFLVLLDATIVYVALPRIQRELGFSAGDVHWIMTIYLLLFGGLLIFGGRVAAAVGWRRMFGIGTAVFVAGSALSGAAWSPGALLAGRAVQAIGAALFAPTTLPLLAQAFDEVQRRRYALGVWTAIGALTGTAGLLIGGPLTDLAGWRSIFFLNVPVGIALLVMASILLPAARRSAGDSRAAMRQVDVTGAVALTAALVLVTAAVAEIGRVQWAVTAGLLALSAVAFAAFAVVEARAPNPLVPTYLLRVRKRGGGLLVLFSAGVAVDGASLLLTLDLQGVRGYSATMFGLVMTVMTLSSVVGSFVGQALAARGWLTVVAATSLALTGTGLIVLSAVEGSGGYVLLGLLVLGSGLGAAFVSGQIAVVSGAAPADSLPTSGLADTAFSIGGALGLATVSTVLVHGQTTPPGLVPAAGFRFAFLTAAALTMIGLAATLLLRRRRTAPAGGGGPVPPTLGANPMRAPTVGWIGRSMPIPVSGNGRVANGGTH